MEFKLFFKIIILCFSLLVVNAFAQTGDSTINDAIKTKIAADSALANNNVIVTTSHGVVHLTGTVNSDAQASMLIEMAQSVAGVSDVDTGNLKVTESNQPLTDTYITAKIKGMFVQQKLFGDKDISAMSISVETNNGVVTLSGTAENQTQINNAISIAKAISGVKEVKSIATIENPKTT